MPTRSCSSPNLAPIGPSWRTAMALRFAACVAALGFTAPAHAEPVLATAVEAARPAAGSGYQEPAPPMCRFAEKGPRLESADPRTRAIVEVWQRVERPFAALTGRQTALTVLGDAARHGEGEDARPFSPTAFICPGAPPVVYVPYSLVKLVFDDKRYPVAFLAFVIGHELGHRANDFDQGGCGLAAFQRPGQGKNEEELADKRAAFFTAIGGYSTRTLAREDTVGAFLAQEFQVRRFDLQKRKGLMLEALSHFEPLESVYQTSMVLALSGETAAAARLLGWAEELIRSRGVPLPEMLVARALVLMMEAAPQAPWLANAKLPVNASHLRCAPIFAAHTALWEEPEPGAVTRGAGDEQEAARRNLVLARKLLQEAEEMGAGRLTTQAGLACAAFYLGEADVARRHGQEAEKLAPKSAPPAVRLALQANLALVAFLEALDKEPTPPQTDDKALGAWGRKIAARKKSLGAHAQLGAVVDALGKLPKRVPVDAQAGAPRCVSRTPPSPAPVQLPEAPPPERKLGACPAGWRLLHTLPALEVAKQTGSPTGVTTCALASSPTDRVPSMRWVSVDLPGATSPPLEPLRTRMRIVEAGAVALPSLDAFACACGDGMQSMGVSDIGARAFMVACEPYGVGLGVLFAAADGVLQRLAVIDSE